MPGSQDSVGGLASEQIAGSFTCHLCFRKYKSRTSLKAHLKTNHRIGCSEPKIKCHYTDCDFRCYKLNQLVNHLSELHQFEVQFESLCFYSKEEFFNWKQEEEQRQNCFWYHSKSYKLTDNYVDVFSCNRSGHPKISVRERKRQLKAHGYIKCGNICISHLRLTHFYRSKKSKTYHLSYLKTHSGHTLEPAGGHTDHISKPTSVECSRLSSDHSTDECHSKSLSSIESLAHVQLNEDTRLSATTIECEPDQMLTSFSDKTSTIVNNFAVVSLDDSHVNFNLSDVQILTNSTLANHNITSVLNSSLCSTSLTSAQTTGTSFANHSLANTLLCDKSEHMSPSASASPCANANHATNEILSFHNYAAKPPPVPSLSETNVVSTNANQSNRPENINGTDSESYVLVFQTENTSAIPLNSIQSNICTQTSGKQSNVLNSLNGNKQMPVLIQTHESMNTPHASNLVAVKADAINGSCGNTANVNQSPLQRQSELVRQRVQQRIQRIMSSSLLLHQLNELDQFLDSYASKHCSRQ